MRFYNFFNTRFKLIKFLLIAAWYRPRNDKGSSRIIYQNTIYFIHHRKMMFALNHFFRRMHHIVTQIIETKFIISAINYIASISLSAIFAIRLMLINTIYGKPKPFKQSTIPFTITASEIVIHRYNMNAMTSKRIQISRQCRYQRFTFTCCHFSNFSLVQNNTSYQLNIIMNHVPGYFSSACNPFIFINDFITFNTNVFFSDSKSLIKLRSSGF